MKTTLSKLLLAGLAAVGTTVCSPMTMTDNEAVSYLLIQYSLIMFYSDNPVHLYKVSTCLFRVLESGDFHPRPRRNRAPVVPTSASAAAGNSGPA